MGNMGVASFTRCRIPHLIAALTCVAKTYSVLCYAAAPLVLMNIALFGQSPDVCYSTVRSSATAARRSTNDCSSADLADAGVGGYRPLPHDFAHGGCHETTTDTSRVYQATPGREGRNDGQSWSVFGLVDHPRPPMPSQLGVASGLVQGSVPTHRCAPVPVLHRIPMKPYTHLWLHQLASECDAKYSTLGQHAYTYSHE